MPGCSRRGRLGRIRYRAIRTYRYARGYSGHPMARAKPSTSWRSQKEAAAAVGGPDGFGQLGDGVTMSARDEASRPLERHIQSLTEALSGHGSHTHASCPRPAHGSHRGAALLKPYAASPLHARVQRPRVGPVRRLPQCPEKPRPMHLLRHTARTSCVVEGFEACTTRSRIESLPEQAPICLKEEAGMSSTRSVRAEPG